MSDSDRFEAHQVALLKHPKSGELVGRLYLWENGEVDPMWFGEEVIDAIADPLPGESPNWASWPLT